MSTKKEKCSGSCGEEIPVGHEGAYTESCRTVVHHSKGVCHYRGQNCDVCHLQSESIEWDKEKETGYPRYVLDIIEDCGHFEEMQKLLEISDGKLPSDEWNKIMDASVKKLVYAFHQAITTAVAKREKELVEEVMKKINSAGGIGGLKHLEEILTEAIIKSK